MKDIVERLREHVNNRGGPSLQNGAWQMMLDAADDIDRLREMCTNREEFIAQHNLWKEFGKYLSEPGVRFEPYSFSMDYGKDLLTDINQMVHRGGTNALIQDCLKRCHREIRQLREALAIKYCVDVTATPSTQAIGCWQGEKP